MAREWQSYRLRRAIARGDVACAARAIGKGGDPNLPGLLKDVTGMMIYEGNAFRGRRIREMEQLLRSAGGVITLDQWMRTVARANHWRR